MRVSRRIMEEIAVRNLWRVSSNLRLSDKYLDPETVGRFNKNPTNFHQQSLIHEIKIFKSKAPTTFRELYLISLNKTHTMSLIDPALDKTYANLIYFITNTCR